MLSAVLFAGLGLLLLWALANALLMLVYRRELRCLWREPVFRHPVLIIESDDWGAGPLAQAAALHDIAEVLGRYRDRCGRAPTFSLALVLAVADGPAIAASGSYRQRSLDDALFEPVLAALRSGQSRGLFSLQLHGMVHYWPAALMACSDVTVKDWLHQPVPSATEQLPSHLQSRWCDSTRLPSSPHGSADIRAAVADEVHAFTRILGQAPQVVVPPTFVWTRDTELAWAEQGLAFIVTPGWRYTARDAKGVPSGDEGPITNGDRAGPLTYLRRLDYFEPARDRDAAHALAVLERAASEGRPCVLENHRDNFINALPMREHSLAELDKLYRGALARHGDLRFLSSVELGRILRDRDPRWLITRAGERLPHLGERLRHSGRCWKLMTLSGLAAIVNAAAPRSAEPGQPNPPPG